MPGKDRFADFGQYQTAKTTFVLPWVRSGGWRSFPKDSRMSVLKSTMPYLFPVLPVPACISDCRPDTPANKSSCSTSGSCLSFRRSSRLSWRKVIVFPLSISLSFPLRLFLPESLEFSIARLVFPLPRLSVILAYFEMNFYKFRLKSSYLRVFKKHFTICYVQWMTATLNKEDDVATLNSM